MASPPFPPFIALPFSNITAALSLVPADVRSQVEHELLGATWPFGAQQPAAPVATPRSFPLTLDQARQLARARVDGATWQVVTALLDAYDNTGAALLPMPEITRITGATEWKHFAQGRLGGLHVALRHIAGVPPRAELLWWAKPNGMDTVNLDGPAIATLRTALEEVGLGTRA
jgi:hypothetical protein